MYISFNTELELLGYPHITTSEKIRVKEFLNDCIIVDLNESIKGMTIEIKQKLKIKLPDAIIAAKAKYLKMPLISADFGFGRVKEIELVSYLK